MAGRNIPKTDTAAVQSRIRGTGYTPPKRQLLKWIGNKQRFAGFIANQFPEDFNRYIEPFLGSGALLATVGGANAYGSDTFPPLMQIWRALASRPSELKAWYADRWRLAQRLGKEKAYASLLASYNTSPNGADLVFLCRACYGGVVRFRQRDGHMSTPCGSHSPISPESFAVRVDEWHRRVRGAHFSRRDYWAAMQAAQARDLVYCDPPYSHSQAILYGAQDFRIEDLMTCIADCKERGVFVALSIDGKKKSGTLTSLAMPAGLFERELFVPSSPSMLKRFQMAGRSLEQEEVADRLLLTY